MTCKTLILALFTLIASPAFAENIIELRPDIEDSAQRNGVDPVLLEAILRHESGNGKSRAARVYNNLGGVMKGAKLRKFESQEDSVEYVAQILSKYRTIGLVSIEQIGRRYAPSHRREWVGAVSQFKRMIEKGTI